MDLFSLWMPERSMYALFPDKCQENNAFGVLFW
jgi:hypothetical protein